MFQFPGWMRKNFISGNFSWRVLAETWDSSCFKKGRLEKQKCYKHLWHIAIEKHIFSELNIFIFQISLKYIKLVIPEILFTLVLCNFNSYFKITWPPPQKYPSPIKKKFQIPPSKNFSKIFNPPPTPSWGERGSVCMTCRFAVGKIIWCRWHHFTFLKVFGRKAKEATLATYLIKQLRALVLRY